MKKPAKVYLKQVNIQFYESLIINLRKSKLRNHNFACYNSKYINFDTLMAIKNNFIFNKKRVRLRCNSAGAVEGGSRDQRVEVCYFLV